jgi:hypothetical protein
MKIKKVKKSQSSMAKVLVCWDWKEKKPNCR